MVSGCRICVRTVAATLTSPLHPPRLVPFLSRNLPFAAFVFSFYTYSLTFSTGDFLSVSPAISNLKGNIPLIFIPLTAIPDSFPAVTGLVLSDAKVCCRA